MTDRRITGFLAVFLKEVSIHRRDPQLVVLLIIAPLALIILLSSSVGQGTLAFGGGLEYIVIGEPGEESRTLEQLEEILGPPEDFDGFEQALRRVQTGEPPLAVLPSNSGPLRLYVDPGQAGIGTSVGQRMAAELNRDVDVVTAHGTSMEDASSPYVQTVPGFMVMFAFFAAMFTSFTFYRETAWHTWERVITLPLAKWQIILGKVVPSVIIVTLQAIIILGFGRIVYGLPLGNIAWLLLAIVLVGWVTAALGIFITAITRTVMQAQQLSNLVVIILATIGGALVPLWTMPQWVQQTAPATPHYWALRFFRDVMVRHLSSSHLMIDGAILLGFGIVLYLVGSWQLNLRRLRFER